MTSFDADRALLALKEGASIDLDELTGLKVTEDEDIEDWLPVFKAKPTVQVRNTSSSLASLRFKLAFSLQSNDPICPEYVLEYLAKLGESLKSKYDAPWKSCKLTLHGAGSAPATAMVNIVWTDDPGRLIEDSDMHRVYLPKHDASLIIALLGGMRVTASHAAQWTALWERLGLQYKKAPLPNIDELPQLTHQAYHNDPSVIKLACALDCFFFKNRTHELAYSRIATLHLRGQGCATLTSLGQIIKPLSMEIRDLSYWLWKEDLIMQLLKTLRDPFKEFVRKDSYIHYILGFGIASRSPYSATACPELFGFLHVVGVTLSVSRSMNATMPSLGIPNDIMFNAAALAYHARKDNSMRYFGKQNNFSLVTKIRYEARINQSSSTSNQHDNNPDDGEIGEAIEEDEEEIPVALDDKGKPLNAGLSMFLALGDKELQKKVRLNASKQWAAIVGPRDKTISAYLKSQATSFVSD